MRRDLAVAKIAELCRQRAGFKLDAASLAAAIATPDRDGLIEALLECGAIPESFDHDSSEEKLYAKYCDVLLAEAFTGIGIGCSVIEERADSADVLGENDRYSIVGDAKAFRLSRTAKNQKDFKVTALSGWRGDKDYACLVCPIYQYPSTRSQIYTQAIDKNVTMLGYVHLAFLLDRTRDAKPDLSPIWRVGTTLDPSNEAVAYWQAIDDAVTGAVGAHSDDLDQFRQRERDVLDHIKRVEVAHLEAEAVKIRAMTKEEAIQRLIAEMNIPSRIAQIQGVAY